MVTSYKLVLATQGKQGQCLATIFGRMGGNRRLRTRNQHFVPEVLQFLGTCVSGNALSLSAAIRALQACSPESLAEFATQLLTISELVATCRLCNF